MANFWSLYQDKKYYITGVGTKDEETGIVPNASDIGGTGDIMTAYTGKPRVAAMLDNLDRYSESVADDNAAFNIDIVGFSRGAAEARDFANQLAAKMKGGYYYYTNRAGKDSARR